MLEVFFLNRIVAPIAFIAVIAAIVTTAFYISSRGDSTCMKLATEAATPPNTLRLEDFYPKGLKVTATIENITQTCFVSNAEDERKLRHLSLRS